MTARRAASGPTSARHRAREMAFRVAYQSDVGGEAFAANWASQPTRDRLSPDQRELIDDVVGMLEHDLASIDTRLKDAASHWPVERMSATDRSVLRAAVAELLARPGTPARVVLDEAIEIAKRYGSEESGKFVNGVLDRIARELRGGEF